MLSHQTSVGDNTITYKQHCLTQNILIDDATDCNLILSNSLDKPTDAFFLRVLINMEICHFMIVSLRPQEYF